MGIGGADNSLGESIDTHNEGKLKSSFSSTSPVFIPPKRMTSWIRTDFRLFPASICPGMPTLFTLINLNSRHLIKASTY
jgi:hypothetical protein